MLLSTQHIVLFLKDGKKIFLLPILVCIESKLVKDKATKVENNLKISFYIQIERVLICQKLCFFTFCACTVLQKETDPRVWLVFFSCGFESAEIYVRTCKKFSRRPNYFSFYVPGNWGGNGSHIVGTNILCHNLRCRHIQ